MSSPKPSLLTPGEYLELERKSEIRSEYIARRMFAMSGANRWHSLIAGNFYGELSSQMRRRSCEAYVSGMRVKVSSTGMYTYPDIVAVCGEPRFEDEHTESGEPSQFRSRTAPESSDRPGRNANSDGGNVRLRPADGALNGERASVLPAIEKVRVPRLFERSDDRGKTPRYRRVQLFRGMCSPRSPGIQRATSACTRR
jgi:hypothetical protein